MINNYKDLLPQERNILKGMMHYIKWKTKDADKYHQRMLLANDISKCKDILLEAVEEAITTSQVDTKALLTKLIEFAKVKCSIELEMGGGEYANYDITCYESLNKLHGELEDMIV